MGTWAKRVDHVLSSEPARGGFPVESKIALPNGECLNQTWRRPSRTGAELSAARSRVRRDTDAAEQLQGRREKRNPQVCCRHLGRLFRSYEVSEGRLTVLVYCNASQPDGFVSDTSVVCCASACVCCGGQAQSVSCIGHYAGHPDSLVESRVSLSTVSAVCRLLRNLLQL